MISLLLYSAEESHTAASDRVFFFCRVASVSVKGKHTPPLVGNAFSFKIEDREV